MVGGPTNTVRTLTEYGSYVNFCKSNNGTRSKGTLKSSIAKIVFLKMMKVLLFSTLQVLKYCNNMKRIYLKLLDCIIQHLFRANIICTRASSYLFEILLNGNNIDRIET